MNSEKITELNTQSADILRARGGAQELVMAMLIEEGFVDSLDKVMVKMQKAMTSGENVEMTPGAYVSALIKMVAIQVASMVGSQMDAEDSLIAAKSAVQYFQVELYRDTFKVMGMHSGKDS